MAILFKLWPYLKEYKIPLVVVLVSGLFMSITTASMAYFVRELFNAFEAKDAKLIYLIPFLMLLAYLIHGGSRYLHTFLLKYTMDKVIAKIRLDLHDKFLKLNLSYHFNYRSGGAGLLSQTLNDVNIISLGLMLIADVLREPVTVIILLSYMFYLDWQLTLVSLVFLPIFMLALRSISKSLRKHSKNQLESLEDLSGTFKETFDGIRVIQSFNLESQMRKKLQEITNRYLKTRKSIYKREEATGPISEVLGAFVFSGIAIYIGHNIVHSNMQIADFVAFLTAAFSIQPAIKKLQEAYVRIQQCVVASDRLITTLNDPNEVKEAPKPIEFPNDWSTIEIRDLSFKYKDNYILKKLNFKIRRGQVVALVGESGSGKSTIINLLMRFFEPNEGGIFVEGININQFSLASLRKNIAMVSQDVFLFNDTIAANILIGDLAKKEDYLSASKSANAHNFIESLEGSYSLKVGERGNLLSGGEKQRISMARAFYKDAPILILDEATSALDSISEVEVQKGLNELMSGRTAIVVAHRLSTIVKSDCIMVLKNGEIVESGSHKELIAKNGDYKKFYDLQANL